MSQKLQLKNAELDRKQKAKNRDLATFTCHGWNQFDPAELRWNWHLDYLCEYLTLAYQRIIKRLIINVPPRSTKSRLVNVSFPAWCWSQDPSLSFINATYEQSLSTEMNVHRRNLLESEWFQRTFPDIVSFAADQNQKQAYANTSHGRMIATSMGGAVTGKGGDVMIIDDPLNPKMAFSEVERNTVNQDYDTTFRSRLNDPTKGVVIVIMQRTHERDLTGHLLSREPGQWTHVRIPFEAEEDEEIVFPISGRVVKRVEGQLFWEKRFPREWAEVEKVGMGSYAWAGQMQQRPAPLGGGIIKRDWIQYYKQADLPAIRKGLEECCQSWDMTFKKNEGNAFVAGQVWGRRNADFYLLANVHARLDLPESCDAVRRLTREWPEASAIYIEDAANGPAVMQTLRDEIAGMIPVNPEGDKVARCHAASPVFESRHVWVPDPTECPWVLDVINEWVSFPNSPYKDNTDAMSQALNKMKRMTLGLVEALKRLAAGGSINSQLHLPADVEAKMQKIAKPELIKPAVSSTSPTCPKCGYAGPMIVKRAGSYRCNSCGAQFGDTGVVVTAAGSRKTYLQKG